MSEKPQEPRIDWSKIELPSAHLTVQKVCEVEGLLAQKDCRHYDKFGGFALNYILEAERALAVRAYCKASGIPQPDDDPRPMTRRGWLLELNDRYRAYGISTGMQVTNQLVRNMEESAVRYAREQLGKSP